LKTLQFKYYFWQRRDTASFNYLQHYYNRANNPYWEMVSEDKWKAVRPLAVQLAGLQPGERVLDLATGAGFQAAAFAAEGHTAIGLDYVFDRLQVASSRHPNGRLSWVVANAVRIPLAANACEVVTISLALHDMPLPTARTVLNEVRRVAGRRVVIIEPRLPKRNFFRLIYTWLAVLFDESPFVYDYLYCDVEALFQEASLKLIDSRICCHHVLVIYVCDF
jgi:demethylmenaquinone methyltransferase/2-methoxy-6-polyprenyl-1,4-benzoquinol methylase